jgi:hypothetical protein
VKGTSADKLLLQGAVGVSPSVRIIADINQNRHNKFDQAYVDANETYYYGPVISTTAGFGGEYYKDAFPISSVVKPMRPQSSGIAWATQIQNNSDGQRPYNVLHGFGAYNALGTAGTGNVANYNSSEDYYYLNPRLYYRGPGIAYQNFTKASSRDGWFMWTPFETLVKYETSFWTNKLSIGFETTMGDPSSGSGLTISLTNDGGSTWTSIKSSGVTVLHPSVDSDGRVTLYRNSDGTWTTSMPAYSNSFWDSSSGTIPNATRINGVKIECATPYGPVVLIEVRPSLTTDITHRISEWSWDANIAEQDSLHPVGTVSSNRGSLTLVNDDDKLSEQNRSDSSCYISELSREFCEFSCFLTASPIATVDIPQFKAFGNIWTDSSDDVYSVEITDIIGILQEMEAPQLLLNNVTPTQAIWRALDIAGVGPVKIKKTSDEEESKFAAIWCDKDQTIWDFIKSVCADSRYAVYVDETGVINIVTNKYIFRDNATSWTFRSTDSTGGTAYYADIQEISIDKTEPINTVNLDYSIPRKSSVDVQVGKVWGNDTTALIEEIPNDLWRPEGGVLLGLGVLRENLTTGATGYMSIYTDAFGSASWGQFSGYAMIDQEIIKYDSAEFSFKNSADGVTLIRDVKDNEDFKSITGQSIGKVSFTGKLKGLTRGQFNTTPAMHENPIQAWTPSVPGVLSLRQQPNNITGVITKSMQIYRSNAGLTGRTTAFKDFGSNHSHWFANVKISDTSDPNDRGGIVIWPQTSGNNITAGLWVEIRPVKAKEVNKYSTEMTLYVTNSSGARVAKTTKTFDLSSAIFNKPIEIWANKDSAYRVAGHTRWWIWVNRTKIWYFDLKDSSFPQKTKLGLFSRGKSAPLFDYAGGSSRSKNINTTETTYMQDLRDTITNILSYDKVIKKSNISIDNFDSAVRGIYYQKVHFNKGPAREVRMIPYANESIKRGEDSGDQQRIAKDGDVAYTISKTSPWYAEVLLCNTSRRPVLLNSSNLYFPLLFGSIVEKSNQQNVTKEDKESVNRKGVKNFDGKLSWTSSRSAAEALAKNILDVSANGTDYIEIKSFTNPLVSLCDIIEIDYPTKNLNVGDKFVVFQINCSWSEGPEYTIKAVRRQSV